MTKIKEFLQSEVAGGIILIIASLFGILLANSPFSENYFSFLETKIGSLSILLWINDALMAIFFLLVGLEIKREMICGQLDTNEKRILPTLAAFFGLVCPAIIYSVINHGNPEAMRGWGIPTATDIAFALGVLALLGDRVPASLKVFLAALAIMDDLMAIVIIAIFYSTELAWFYLGGALLLFIVLMAMNKKNVTCKWAYMTGGFLLWICVLKSGIHATLAGVILAMTIPYKVERNGTEVSPLLSWEHTLSPWVAFLIVPLFGFSNAGVSFGDVTLGDLAHPVVLGISLGLFFGKQIGVMGLVYSLVRFKIVSMPQGASWKQVYGVSLLCGIGFTMSLFVSMLAFNDPHMLEYAKIGVFMGSSLAGLAGYTVLRLIPPAN